LIKIKVIKVRCFKLETHLNLDPVAVHGSCWRGTYNHAYERSHLVCFKSKHNSTQTLSVAKRSAWLKT